MKRALEREQWRSDSEILRRDSWDGEESGVALPVRYEKLDLSDPCKEY